MSECGQEPMSRWERIPSRLAIKQLAPRTTLSWRRGGRVRAEPDSSHIERVDAFAHCNVHISSTGDKSAV